MDMGADDAADGQWLTHSEIAAIRGISTASAIKLALRNSTRSTAGLADPARRDPRGRQPASAEDRVARRLINRTIVTE